MSNQQLERFSEILLPSDQPFLSYSCNGSTAFGPLSLINLFIGTNNSGKSRLLRAIFSLKQFNYTTNTFSADIPYALAQNAKLELERIFLGHGVTSVGGITSEHFEEVLKLDSHFVSNATPIHKPLEARLQMLLNIDGSHINFKGTSRRPDSKAVTSDLKAFGSKMLDHLSEHKADTAVDFKKRYYIPILRGMRPLENDHINRYKSRTERDYFSSPNQGLTDETQIFTGLELYQMLKNKLLGEPEDRDAVRRFEDFLSGEFFQSRQITLIPYEGDTTVHIKIGKDKQLPIYQLGDGLQSLLICAFNIFMEHDRCLFFLEEPDVCMHPSLQRSFLEVISTFSQHQYFITTHSNHFLDMTLDFSNVSVFHFSKADDTEKPFRIQAASSQDRNLLRDLGVRNSSVFLSNATIWVEGITDRLYLRTYMSKFCGELKAEDPELSAQLSNLKEDLHYSFVEYQGANLTHWSFDPKDEDAKRMKATYVCAQAFLIADGDIATKGKREETYKAMLDDRYFVLPAKEIENFIPPEVLKAVVAKEFAEKGIDVELIKYEEYAKIGKGLGAYLDSLLGYPTFAAETGTIKSKIAFCDKAIAVMLDPSLNWSLPHEMKDVCKRIFQHVLIENQMQNNRMEVVTPSPVSPNP